MGDYSFSLKPLIFFLLVVGGFGGVGLYKCGGYVVDHVKIQVEP